MSELINITCVRVNNVLDEYARTSQLPALLLNHTVTMDDLEECFNTLSKYHQHLAVRMIKQYVDHVREDLENIKKRLRSDYNHTLENLATQGAEFQFPTVLARYREHINPVTALYYDTRELMRTYNPEDDRHVWLYGLVTDKKFNSEILDALDTDMSNLEKIVRKYQWPMKQLGTGVPLQIFHAKQIIKDFSQHYVLFAGLSSWDPDE